MTSEAVKLLSEILSSSLETRKIRSFPGGAGFSAGKYFHELATTTDEAGKLFSKTNPEKILKF